MQQLHLISILAAAPGKFHKWSCNFPRGPDCHPLSEHAFKQTKLMFKVISLDGPGLCAPLSEAFMSIFSAKSLQPVYTHTKKNSYGQLLAVRTEVGCSAYIRHNMSRNCTGNPDKSRLARADVLHHCLEGTSPWLMLMKSPDLPFLALLDFLVSLFGHPCLLSLFPFLTRIMGVRQRRTILAFSVVFLHFRQTSKEQKIMEGARTNTTLNYHT